MKKNRFNSMLMGGVLLLAVVSSCTKKDALLQNEAIVGINANSVTRSYLSSPGDVVGKVTAGYQGWFQAPGDGSPFNSWQHTNLECWPDVRQYPITYSNVQFTQDNVLQPPFTGTLGNGQSVKMFSSWDQATVNLHFLWMQQNGIDCAAMQRFGAHFAADPRTINSSNGIADRVQSAAQTYGRKFYIMYDISGWTNFQTEIKTDWTNLMKAHTTSSAYAMQNGKPVVCIWGIGVLNRPGNVTSWTDVVNWFKSQGCYVIEGVSNGFTTDTANLPAYNVGNMLMDWRVGASESTNFLTRDTVAIKYCNAHGIDYQAAVYPGTSFYNGNGTTKNIVPRMHGDYMWGQFAAAKTAGVSSVYISMFDEINEATGVMNCAEDASWVPAGEYFLTLDADGTHVSSDFYLRLVKDGGKMIKGQIPYTSTHPTPHVLTPPASLTPHVLSSSSIQVNWSGVTDAPVYNLKRTSVSGGPYTTIATGLTSATYTNTGLTANTTYYYVVSAGYINGGESINSREVNGKTNP
jgi:hypothetical protein